jgi:5-methylcytosine-specific restriction protein A
VPAHQASDLTSDHIVAKANGGSDDPSNVQVMCRSCNARKHAR